MGVPDGAARRPRPAHEGARVASWSGRRPSPRVRRRRRVLLAAVLAVGIGVAVWTATSGPGIPGPRGGSGAGTTAQTDRPSEAGTAHGSDPSGESAATRDGPPEGMRRTVQAPAALRVRAAVAPFRLPNPITREGALGTSGKDVVLLGGLTATGSSSTEVALLDTSTGKLATLGTLADATHDAGVTALAGRALVVGGGQGTSVPTVQAFPLPGSATAGGTGAVTGQLPRARSDGAAVTVGGTAYVVGGYDGRGGDPNVLATTDGSTFATVAALPVAVRYPAVAARGGLIYVFGGELVTGGSTAQAWTATTRPSPGQEVPVVQVVDPASHKAWVAGRMPHAVEGAAAFILRGHLYLAGGDAQAAGTTPVSGTTIWSYDTADGAFTVAGRLARPVAYAGVAVTGTSAWLVGGEDDGTPVTTVQEVRPAGG